MNMMKIMVIEMTIMIIILIIIISKNRINSNNYYNFFTVMFTDSTDMEDHKTSFKQYKLCTNFIVDIFCFIIFYVMFIVLRNKIIRNV